jgi:hypothetical protein
MSISNSKTRLGLAVLVLNLLAGSQYAHAATCKPSVSGTGTSNITFAVATGAAKASWRSNTISQHGLKYALWLKSANRATNCTKSGKIRTCVVTANPCF